MDLLFEKKWIFAIVGVAAVIAARAPRASADGAPNLLLTGLAANRIEVLCESTAGGLCGDHVRGELFALAGTGAPVNSGDGLLAGRAGVAHPGAAVVDSRGNVVIAVPSSHVVRVVCMNSAGVCAGLTDGTRLYAPGQEGGTLRPEPGHIYHLAGVYSAQSTNPNYGYGSGTGCTGSGEGTPANESCLNQPRGVAVDSFDNILIADSMNRRIRVICMDLAAGDPYCVSQPEANPGAIYTLNQGNEGSAGALGTPLSIAVDSRNDVAVLAISDSSPGSSRSGAGTLEIRMLCAGGEGSCEESPARSGSALPAIPGPGLGFDAWDDLLVSDPRNAAVYCLGARCPSADSAPVSMTESATDSGAGAGWVRFAFY